MQAWRAYIGWGIVLGLWVAGVAPFVKAGETEVKGDLARMQGRWVTRAGERQELKVQLQIKGSNASVTITTPQGLTLEAAGEVRIDESVSPHALDWSHFTGADTIELPDIPAIYEFVDGGFRVCNGGPNNARPTRFQAGSGVLAGLHTFERPAPDAVAERPNGPRR
ncbi:MAG: TIGR03067 domain-containing protein [Isosphaeraceae bacterium]